MTDLLELTARAEDAHFWFHGFRSFVAPVLAGVAAGRPDLRLIDCGAGTGHNLQLLAPHGRVFAFDLAPNALTRTRASTHPLVRADITRIPFAASAFDIATSFDVLQSVPDAQGAVLEMARIVKPGGSVVLTVSALELLRGDHAELWQEGQRYTPAQARALVTNAGLEPLRVSFLFGSLFPLMLGTRLWQRATRALRGAAVDSDMSVPAAPVNAALTALVRGEAALSRHLPMPVGSSLLVVARKPRR